MRNLYNSFQEESYSYPYRNTILRNTFCLLALLLVGQISLSGQASCYASHTATVTAAGSTTILASTLGSATGGGTIYVLESSGVLSTSVDVGCADWPLVTITLVESTTTGISGQVGASCTIDVTIDDDDAPTANCANITVNIEAVITPSDIDDPTNMSGDGCSDFVLSLSGTGVVDNEYEVLCADEQAGSFSLTLTVEDNNGNSGNTATCTSTVTVQDMTTITATCEDITHKLSEGNGLDPEDFVTLNDDCFASQFLSPNSVSCSDVGTPVSVTYTVTDNDGGGSSSCTALITVEDDVPPSDPTCWGSPLTVYFDGSGNASINASQIVDNIAGLTDNCTAPGDLEIVLSQSTFLCNDAGTITITAHVEDAAGNMSMNNCTRDINLVDNQSPTAVCYTTEVITVILDATGKGTLDVATVDDGSTDNCQANLSLSKNMFDCGDVTAENATFPVTLTVTDNAGNSSASCTVGIKVKDDLGPTVTCVDDYSVTLGTGNTLSIAVSDIEVSSNDACGIASRELNTYSLDCDNLGGFDVILTVTDNKGNPSDCTTKITLLENMSGLNAVCYTGLAVDLATSNSLTMADVFNESASSGACGMMATSLTPNTFSCTDVANSPITVTLGITDNTGATAVCMTDVSVSNTGVPSANCQDITVNLDAGVYTMTASEIDNMSTPSASSSAGCDISLSADITDFDCSNVGSPVSVTLTVTEDSGSSSCVAVVTVKDATAPIAECKQDITVNLAEANALLAVDINNGSADECSGVTLSIPTPTFDCTDLGTATITLTATDASMNPGTCTATLMIVDEVAPTATCQDLTLNIEADSGSAVDTTLLTSLIDNGSSDDCTVTGDLVFEFIDGSGMVTTHTYVCADQGSTDQVILRVTDEAGLSSSCTANVAIVDAMDPTLTCKMGTVTITLDAAGTYTLSELDVLDAHSDNCSVSSFSFSPATFSCHDLSSPSTPTISVTATGVDPAGNSGDCTTLVEVVDGMAPVVTCADLPNVEVGTTITPANLVATIQENCTSYVASFDSAGTITSIDYDCDDTGTHSVTAFFTDPSGNQSSCTQDVTIVDTGVPNPNCFLSTGNFSLDSNGDLLISISDIGSPGDNCQTGLQAGLSQAMFDCDDIGTVGVILTVEDASGNSASCTRQINIQDNEDPQLTTSSCPVLDPNNPIVVTLDATGNLEIDLETVTGITATDNCSTELSIYGGGLNNGGVLGFGPPDFDKTANNNCGDDFGFDRLTTTTLDCDDVGEYWAIIGVADQSNDISSGSPVLGTCRHYDNLCTVLIRVNDAAAPTAVCVSTPVPVSLEADGTAFVSATLIDDGSSDDCTTLLTTVLSPNTFDCSHIGSNSVQLMVVDESGATDVCSASVTISDMTAPTAACNDVLVELDANGMGTVTAADFDVQGISYDACGIKTVSTDLSSLTFDCDDINTVSGNEVIVTYTDFYNNSSSATCEIAIVDNIAPVVACQDITVQLEEVISLPVASSSSSSGIIILQATADQDDLILGTPTDKCDMQLTLNPTDWTWTGCSQAGGIHPRTITVTDAYGNVGSATCNVTIQGTYPTAICQDYTVSLDAVDGEATINVDDLDNGSYDACDESTSTDPIVRSLDQTTFGCSHVGVPQIVTLTVTDNDNMSSTAVCEVTVLDVTPPVAVCKAMPEVTLSPTTGEYTIEVADVAGISTDNCGIVSTSTSISSVSVPSLTVNCAYLNTATTIDVDLTVSDGLLTHTETCNVSIKNPAPVAKCQDITVYLNSSGPVTIIAAQVDNSTTPSYDICNQGLMLTLSKSSFNCADALNGPVAVTLTATDPSGNSDQCTASVTVETDITAQCQDKTVYLGTNDEVTVTIADIDNGSSTSCGVLSLGISSPATFSCAQVGQTVPVTLSASDGISGDDCVAMVTIESDPALPCQCIPDYRIATDNPIPNPVLDGYYPAIIDIECDAVVPVNGLVEFKAGSSILLLPGFEVNNNTVFLAHIGPCP